MTVIKYHAPLAYTEIRTRTDEAVKHCSYVELMNALINIDDVPFDREALIKEFRKMSQRPAHDRTDFESTLLMVVMRDLEQEIINNGK